MKPTLQDPARRDFLKTTALAGAGLAVACYVPEALGAEPAAFQPNAWVRVAPSGEVSIWVAKSELGQGSHTGLAMIVAEELDADWQKVKIERAVLDAKYGEQGTGGSTAIRSSWLRLRRAGAAARAMLIEAAAQQWKVPAAQCDTQPGSVVHKKSGRKIGYGALAEAAAKLPVPQTPTLKDPKAFRYVGQRLPRVDGPDKVRGTAQYGIDVRRPDMLFATVVHCPVFGGKLTGVDAAKAKAMTGVRQVVEMGNAVGVIADSTWHAMEAAKALEVHWDEGGNANLSSATLRAEMEEALKKPARVRRNDGDVEAALADAKKKIEAVYEMPYLPHAPLEPTNCTADVRGDAVEMWAPTQFPQLVRASAAGALKIAPEKIEVNITYSGGGFGRRIIGDYGGEAALLSKAAGAPVQVVWTRQEDFQHDFYRPGSLHRVAGAVDPGYPSAWLHRVVCPSIGQYLEGGSGEDDDVATGAVGIPYAIPNLRVEQVTLASAVPLGYWRSVYDSQTAYVNEHFLDELAALAGLNPLDARVMLIAGSRPEYLDVLRLVHEKSGWAKPLPEGRTRGVAFHHSFTSTVAHVAEVSVESSGRVRVHKVTTAVDCGTPVNPALIEQQMHGAVTLGLTAFFSGPLKFERGRAQASNFNDYGLLAIGETPEVEVHIVPSTDAPRGIGEPGLPPIAPAVANAIFAATKKPIRTVPYRA